MSTRKTTVFYVLLSAVLSFAVALVIASRLDLTPSSSAQSLVMPAMNSAPIAGALDAQTFRNVAKAESPMVVNIRTEMRQRTQDLSDFFGCRGGSGGSGGGSNTPDDFLHRFFGQQQPDGTVPFGLQAERPLKLQRGRQSAGECQCLTGQRGHHRIVGVPGQQRIRERTQTHDAAPYRAARQKERRDAARHDDVGHRRAAAIQKGRGLRHAVRI